MLMSIVVLMTAEVSAADKPNVVIILADDLGYGDLHCYNPDSKVPTPHLDKLAAQGMRFTDAHSPASWCTPTRYSLLTGRYPTRNALKWRDGPIIEPGRLTIASMLRQHGYTTAAIGKWHLGIDVRAEDYSDIRGGPVDHGFDHSFNIPASLDIPPYYYFSGHRAVQPPTGHIDDNNSEGWTKIQGAFWRGGPIAPNFKMTEVLPTLTDHAVDYLTERGADASGKPFMLYLALTAPHTPWLPPDDFRGHSGASMYGDFVSYVDANVGRVLAALDKAGLADNTIVVFTSDNGPVWYPDDVKRLGHDATGGFRGMKGDLWEGGHRMPLLVRWPGKVQAGAVNDRLICQVDLLATLAAVVAHTLKPGDAEDSVNMLPALTGRVTDESALRQTLLSEGTFRRTRAIRKGSWKLIPILGSGGFTRPARIKPKSSGPAGQLYNLAVDPHETNNVYADHPDIVAELSKLLDQYPLVTE